MDNKTYDMIKMVALLVAPFIVLVSAILNIWDVPYADQLTASLSALDVCIGSVVVILKNMYDSNNDDDCVG